jgi:hypothetical protein
MFIYRSLYSDMHVLATQGLSMTGFCFEPRENPRHVLLDMPGGALFPYLFPSQVINFFLQPTDLAQEHALVVRL